LTLTEQLLGLAVVVGPVLLCIPLAQRRRPGRRAAMGAVATAVLALVWDWHKAPYEGPAIIEFSHDHGLTVVDLVVPAALAVAAAVLWRYRRG
jgi:hypothetical protein